MRGIYKMLKMDDFTNVLTQVIGAEETYGANGHSQVSQNHCQPTYRKTTNLA